MTFIEKLISEYPEQIPYNPDKTIRYLDIKRCPSELGYEPQKHKHGCDHPNLSCMNCWNREIPGTENDILKGETEMVETRKTKKELLEEIAELKKEVKDLQDREEYEKCAKTMKLQCDALIDAGFSHDAAFQILLTMIKSAGGVN